MNELLSLTGLRYQWLGADQPALQIEHLSVQAGERLFVIGPSGCGKTTLLSLIAGIATPQVGEIVFQGERVSGWRPSQRDRLRADQFGIVFQLFNLLPYLSVLDNVLLTAQFSSLRRQRATRLSGSPRAEAERLLGRLGLPAKLWQRPATALSVGQQQRVAVARALFGRPAMLLVDEPTSALDSQHRDRFISLLTEECQAVGAALFFVSHDVSLSQHFSRVVDLATLNSAAHVDGDAC